MESKYKIRDERKVVYPELSFEIMGILFEVHKELGGRYQEKYYQRAVALGLDKKGIKYKKELLVDLVYNESKIGKYFLDFLIEDKIVLELKTVPFLGHEEQRQVFAYLKSKNLQLGILVNFRGQSLTYKRIINPDFNKLNGSD